METKYLPSEGARLNKEEAERYGTRINQLTQDRGFITPELVVEDAKNTNSPLHDYFNWDNREAAEKWRLEQAKYLIRHIVVTVLDETKPEIRQFYSITPTPEMRTDSPKVYVTLNTIMNDEEKRAEVIGYALRELRGWTERYRQYSELKGIIRSIEAKIKKVKTKH